MDKHPLTDHTQSWLARRVHQEMRRAYCKTQNSSLIAVQDTAKDVNRCGANSTEFDTFLPIRFKNQDR